MTPDQLYQPDEYEKDRCAVFRYTHAPLGGLSNMAAGFPLRVAAVVARTPEALYQALRYPHHPHVQEEILAQKSPMAAKMVSKRHKAQTRPDWDDGLRVVVMLWVLRVKLAQHMGTYQALLASTSGRSIVEESLRDDFWGARSQGTLLRGRNVLGKLHMIVRDLLDRRAPALDQVPDLTLKVPDFLLLGAPATAPA